LAGIQSVLQEDGMTDRSNNLERRTAHRIPVSIQAVLYYNSLMLSECQVRDLSLKGAFIDTGGHFLPDQALADLVFSVRVADGVSQRFTVQVMRCTEEGVGVRLQYTDSGSLRNLVETLYAA
jgi:hypothetical protein